jgi:hypothetical protein
MLEETPEAPAADPDTDPPKIKALGHVAERFYELVPHIDISLLDVRTIGVVVNSSTQAQQDLQILAAAARQRVSLPSSESFRGFYKLSQYIPAVAALRPEQIAERSALLELAWMRTPLPQNQRKNLADRLGKFSAEIRKDLIAVLERYLEKNIPLESFYEILRVAPTASQINLGTHLDVPLCLFKDCLTALKNSTGLNLKRTAHLVNKLRLISEAQQAQVIGELTSSGIEEADRTLSKIITEAHTSARNSSYGKLDFKYSGTYTALERALAEEIFRDSLFIYELTNHFGERYRSISDHLLRHELATILNSSPENHKSSTFTCSLLALIRELYYRETRIYPSDSEILGVIMLCDSRAWQIAPKKQAKLLTGYTACSNNTGAMLALVAAFKAKSLGVRQIDIFVGDARIAEEYTYTHHNFFSSLGIKSDDREDRPGTATQRVAFTTTDNAIEEESRDAPGAIQVADKIALIDGSSLSLAGGLLIHSNNVSPSAPSSLFHEADLHALSDANPSVDEFLGLHPEFNSLPIEVISLCLRIAPRILPKNSELSLGTAKLYPTDITSKYSAILNLTTSSKSPGHESILHEAFGESRLELMLPVDEQFKMADSYSIRLKYSEWGRTEAVIKKASELKRDKERLVIFTDTPQIISRSLRAKGIQNILLNEEDQEPTSDCSICSIFVCHTNNSAVFYLDSSANQNIRTPDLKLVVLIASNIRTPEELENIRQIGPRSGVNAETIHLISIGDSECRPDIFNIIGNISKNGRNRRNSSTLIRCINFVRDAESILKYTTATLWPGGIKFIREALRSYENGDRFNLNLLSELPELAEAIFESLHEQNVLNMLGEASYIDMPDFAAVEFLDSQRYRELAELCDAFEKHFSRTIQEIFRALDAERERNEEISSEYREDITDLSAPPGEAPSHERQIEYGHLTRLFCYYAHKIAVSKQAASEITAEDVWRLLDE